MVHEDLRDNITVSVNIPNKVRVPKVKGFGGIFAKVEEEINSKLQRAKQELAPAVGQELANRNKFAQYHGILTFNAVRKGKLLGSIRITGGMGSLVVRYKVGTNMRSDYPHYVVYGRRSATAHNARFLKFVPKGESKPIFRKSVSSASPRNYLARAHAEFEPQISTIVRREVARVLGN